MHPEAVAHAPLPRNVSEREELPGDAGWWGYAFRDVPARTGGETFVATLPDVTVTWYRDPDRGDDFYPALVTREGHALDLREIRFRHPHARTLRAAPPPARMERATWVLERVYDNHSHWLTAHLPKLLLLRERGELDDVLLPPVRSPAMEASLRQLGMDPARFRTFDPSRPLRVGRLTLVGTDRFRPELLCALQRAHGLDAVPAGRRRVYVSRDRANRRRLVNEDEVWPLFADAGFERVFMEELDFDAQVALMRDTQVLAAPHGAGLTNMLFCPRGTAVIEIADLSFPNPNFYALAAALGHPYWLVAGTGVGEGRPIDRDLRVDPAAVADVLAAW
ncbi:glycosyltransferase family 61 protein [Egicoccus halophilus]|uniref:glycosyltransferase family 61 protein n=1 Tax=Egicoccus halophilus TaxID=1670830 RepID=UPI0010323F37|nr:glycosyltransferase family 61 protein [Egicoccus halophilus]